jgi:hypothetical protein
MASFTLQDCAYAVDDVMVCGGYRFKLGESEFADRFVQAFLTFVEEYYEVNPDADDDGDFVPDEASSETLDEEEEDEMDLVQD